MRLLTTRSSENQASRLVNALFPNTNVIIFVSSMARKWEFSCRTKCLNSITNGNENIGTNSKYNFNPQLNALVHLVQFGQPCDNPSEFFEHSVSCTSCYGKPFIANFNNATSIICIKTFAKLIQILFSLTKVHSPIEEITACLSTSLLYFLELFSFWHVVLFGVK